MALIDERKTWSNRLIALVVFVAFPRVAADVQVRVGRCRKHHLCDPSPD